MEAKHSRVGHQNNGALEKLTLELSQRKGMGKRISLTTLVLGAVSLPLAACVTPGPASPGTYSRAAFLTSLKCELATYMVSSPTPGINLEGAKIAAVLNLKVTTNATVEGGLRIEPAIILAEGASLGGGIGAKRVQQEVVEDQYELSFETSAANADVCKQSGRIEFGNAGFAEWLSAELVTAGYPRLRLNKLSRKLTFTLTRSNNAGFALKIIPISLSADASAQRDDAQMLQLTIETPNSPPLAPRS